MKATKVTNSSKINERKAMGLAASQARLLTITARKADCEFQSMNLSHQKLSLSRDMERVSTAYQNALNTTKLVYDYYGAGDSDMALTYGLLMSPSVYNDYYPKFVTDSQNRIVLNSAYAAAARAAGIPAEGLLGTPSSDVRNKFIDALANENIISANKAATIQGVTYGNTVGLGTTVNITQQTAELTYDQLIKQFNAYANSSATDGVSLGAAYSAHGKSQRVIIEYKDGKVADCNEGNANVDITIADLLNDKAQYNLAYESGEGKNEGHRPTETLALLQRDLVSDGSNTGKSILNWINDQFKTVLGGTAAGATAIDYAYNCVYDLLYSSHELQDNSTSYKEDILKTQGTLIYEEDGNNGFQTHVAKNAKNYMGMVFSITHTESGFHTRKNDNATVAVNLNNIAKAFMTSYVEYMQGINDNEYSYQKGEKSKSNLYNPAKDDMTFIVPVESYVDDGDSDLYANFYDAIFNMICVNGWTENPQIDDEQYLSEMLKGGMAFISSISDDGYYYQGNYSTDRYILEVADDEAIAKAEAQYNTEKTKIENKEQTIDIKMKNLDTEISSLTTEYDTTKSIITKAIEKSFKRYEA